jgi:hypothetical protein
MIMDIAGDEVDKKVEKFKEELEIHKETHPFHKAVRSINEEKAVVEEEKGELELSKAAKMGVKFVARKYKKVIHPQVKRDVGKLHHLARKVKEKVLNVGNDFLDGIPLKNPNAVEKAKQIRNYKATKP